MDRQNATLETITHIQVTLQVVEEAGVRLHLQKFWFVENPSKLLKTWAQMAANVVWFQKMAPNISIKTYESLFWRLYQKKVSMIFDLCGDNLQAKSHKTFRESLGKFGQNLSHP